jgi:hypothetical protein
MQCFIRTSPFRAPTLQGNRNKKWSDEDERQLLQLLRETLLSKREIAQKLGRTEAAVTSRLEVINKRNATKSNLYERTLRTRRS